MRMSEINKFMSILSIFLELESSERKPRCTLTFCNISCFPLFTACQTNSKCHARWNQKVKFCLPFLLVPSQNPYIYWYSVVDYSTIWITWHRVEDRYIRGTLLGYRVHILQAEYHHGSQPYKREITIGPDQLDINITGLPTATRFRIWVAAFTSIGEGLQRHEQWIKTSKVVSTLLYTHVNHHHHHHHHQPFIPPVGHKGRTHVNYNPDFSLKELTHSILTYFSHTIQITLKLKKTWKEIIIPIKEHW